MLLRVLLEGAVGFSDLSPEAVGWGTLTTRLSTALRDSLSWVLALGVLSCVWVGQLGLLFLCRGVLGPRACATPLILRMLVQPCGACLVCLSMAPALPWLLCASSGLVPGPAGQPRTGAGLVPDPKPRCHELGLLGNLFAMTSRNGPGLAPEASHVQLVAWI